MNRSLSIALLCVSLAACNGSGDAQNTSPQTTNQPTGTGSNTDPGSGANPAAFDPTAITLDAPPTDGKLPAELLPPA